MPGCGDGEWSYGYDDVPNLKQISPAAEGMSAHYDALNARIKTVYSASTTYSLHAASGELLMQFTPAVKVVELFYLARKPIGFRSRSAGGVVAATHVHNDVFGNPVAGSAGAGQGSPGSLLWTDAFLPYGDRFSDGAQQAGYPLSFQGGRVDLGTDVHRYQFGARIYDPVVGRFLGWDPAPFDETQPASFNRYQYANLNPYKYKDETGRVVETILDIASLSLSIVAFRNDPSLLNGLGLAYDAAATFIPGLPAGAGLVKGAAKAGQAADARKVLEANKAAGDAFEKATREVLERTQTGVVEQLTIKAGSGTKTKLDLAGRDAAGNVCLTECKSSATARLTGNQKKAFPEIESGGGVVVGKGKPGFEEGTRIPPTKVDIRRPE